MMNHELRIKKILIALSLSISIALLLVHPTQILGNGEEVKQGQEIWQKLNGGELKCEGISEEQFEALGEFFMERMLGSSDSHEAMDKQMELMMGKESLQQMHLVMGKRMSGCQVSATALEGSGGMMGGGMMGMMGSAFAPWSFGGTKGGGGTMMGPGMMGWGSSAGSGSGWMMGQGGFWVWSILSWITWILVIVALLAFIRWMWKKGDK